MTRKGKLVEILKAIYNDEKMQKDKEARQGRAIQALLLFIDDQEVSEWFHKCNSWE
jgi:hypothetical protein